MTIVPEVAASLVTVTEPVPFNKTVPPLSLSIIPVDALAVPVPVIV